MPERVALHVITRAQLETDAPYARWSDPDRIAPLSELGRRTLLSNPHLGPPDQPVQIIGTLGDRVIGRMDLIAGELTIDGRAVPIFWASNLYVPEPHRNTLMGVMLIMKGQALHHTTAAFGPSQVAVPVYEKLKWSDLRLRRNVQLRRSRAVVEKLVRPAPLARAASAGADALLLAHRGLLGAWRTVGCAGLRVRRADAMPESFNAHFARRREPVQVHRSARAINWMLANSFNADPRARQDLYFVHAGHAAEPLAYFMTKVRFHEFATSRRFRNLLLGSIQDWMILDERRVTLRQLVMLALRELARQNVDATEINLPESVRPPWLRAMGFGSAGTVHFMFKATPASPLSADPRYARIENWWCRPADGDNFFV